MSLVITVDTYESEVAHENSAKPDYLNKDRREEAAERNAGSCGKEDLI